MQFPPCYKDMSFWISDSFTENNLCEVVRGIAGDLVEEVCFVGILIKRLLYKSFNSRSVVVANSVIVVTRPQV